MINKRIGKSKKFNLGLKTDKARLVYLMIYPHIDVEGRIEADLDDLKVDCFPYLKSMTPARIGEALSELTDVGLIVSYEIKKRPYIQFLDFEKNQPNLRKDREADSKIPPPPPDIIKINSGPPPEDSGLTPAVAPLNLNLKSKFKFKFNSPCPGKTPDEQDLRLTQLLIDLMIQNNPESSIIKRLTEKRQFDWITACRLTREQDERTEEQIEAVIRFSQADSFWKSNILSMPKLREKWDQLWMKMRRTTGADNLDGIKAWLREIEAKNELTK